MGGGCADRKLFSTKLVMLLNFLPYFLALFRDSSVPRSKTCSCDVLCDVRRCSTVWFLVDEIGGAEPVKGVVHKKELAKTMYFSKHADCTLEGSQILACCGVPFGAVRQFIRSRNYLSQMASTKDHLDWQSYSLPAPYGSSFVQLACSRNLSHGAVAVRSVSGALINSRFQQGRPGLDWHKT